MRVGTGFPLPGYREVGEGLYNRDRMRVEVDQSGVKIEKTNRETVLAFANGTSGAIVIPAKVKKQCIRELRNHSWKEQIFIDQIFAAGIFLLIKDYLSRLQTIIIDTEYTGRDGNIKGILLNFIRQEIPTFTKQGIQFRSITKQSPAHRKAYSVYKRLQKPDQVLSTRAILSLLGQ